MPNVLIRDLPEEVHTELVRRSGQRGQSLQQYLAAELTRLATSPTLDDVLKRLEQLDGGRVGFAQAVADLEDERSRR